MILVNCGSIEGWYLLTGTYFLPIGSAADLAALRAAGIGETSAVSIAFYNLLKQLPQN